MIFKDLNLYYICGFFSKFVLEIKMIGRINWFFILVCFKVFFIFEIWSLVFFLYDFGKFYFKKVLMFLLFFEIINSFIFDCIF